jgi:hypothetical protein
MKNGTVLKYNEPPEAKKTKGWRIYIFKDGKEIDVLELGGRSSYLIGRDRTVHSFWFQAKVCRLLIFPWTMLPVPTNTPLYNFGKSHQQIGLVMFTSLSSIFPSFEITDIDPT